MLAGKFASASTARCTAPRACPLRQSRPQQLQRTALNASHRVTIQHQGQEHQLEVPDDQNILEVALENGLSLPHDCKMGVCMTCPAKMTSGSVDQSAGMISEDVAQKGYTLLCVAQPKEPCSIVTISEDELLDLQMNN